MEYINGSGVAFEQIKTDIITILDRYNQVGIEVCFVVPGHLVDKFYAAIPNVLIEVGDCQDYELDAKQARLVVNWRASITNYNWHILCLGDNVYTVEIKNNV